MLTKEQVDFLDKYVKGVWSLNDQGIVDVDGNVNISGLKLTTIPIKFGVINGEFCSLVPFVIVFCWGGDMEEDETVSVFGKCQMNPRYLLWCRFNGNPPDVQLARDLQEWPGGCMCGFMLWISQLKAVFIRKHPSKCLNDVVMDHAAFDSFLAETVNECSIHD